MAVIQRLTTVAAASVNPNLVAGSAFEYPQQPSQVSIGLAQSATGMFVTIYAGSRLIAEEFPPQIGTAFPNIPDGFYYNFVILPQERLVVVARNSTAGALDMRLVVDMQPVA
jgi:hypothetical protein